MDRRQFVKSTGSVIAATGLGLFPRRVLAQDATIKVGLLAPLTGVVASGGRDMVEGTQFYFEIDRQSDCWPQGRTHCRGRRLQSRHWTSKGAAFGRAG